MVKPLAQAKGYKPVEQVLPDESSFDALGLRGSLDADPVIPEQPEIPVPTPRPETPSAEPVQPVTSLDIPASNLQPTASPPPVFEAPAYESVLGAISGGSEQEDSFTDISLSERVLQHSVKANAVAENAREIQTIWTVEKDFEEPQIQDTKKPEEYQSVLGKIKQREIAEKISAFPQPEATKEKGKGMAALVSPGKRTVAQARSLSEIVVSKTPALGKGDISDLTGKYAKNWNFGTMKGNALVIHHTAGRGDADIVAGVFKERGFPAHFVIDRDGVTHQILKTNQRGRHTKNSQINDVTNQNSWGVEIIAKDDKDVTPKQVQAAVRLTKYLNETQGMPLNRVFGHGEINSHKQKTEGATVVEVLRKQK